MDRNFVLNCFLNSRLGVFRNSLDFEFRPSKCDPRAKTNGADNLTGKYKSFKVFCHFAASSAELTPKR